MSLPENEPHPGQGTSAVPNRKTPQDGESSTTSSQPTSLPASTSTDRSSSGITEWTKKLLPRSRQVLHTDRLNRNFDFYNVGTTTATKSDLPDQLALWTDYQRYIYLEKPPQERIESTRSFGKSIVNVHAECALFGSYYRWRLLQKGGGMRSEYIEDLTQPELRDVPIEPLQNPFLLTPALLRSISHYGYILDKTGWNRISENEDSRFSEMTQVKRLTVPLTGIIASLQRLFITQVQGQRKAEIHAHPSINDTQTWTWAHVVDQGRDVFDKCFQLMGSGNPEAVDAAKLEMALTAAETLLCTFVERRQFRGQEAQKSLTKLLQRRSGMFITNKLPWQYSNMVNEHCANICHGLQAMSSGHLDTKGQHLDNNIREGDSQTGSKELKSLLDALPKHWDEYTFSDGPLEISPPRLRHDIHVATSLFKHSSYLATHSFHP